MFGPNNFGGFCTQSFFWILGIFNQSFLQLNIFLTQNGSDPKFFLDPNFVGPKIFLDPIFFDKKSLGPRFFGLEFFGHQFFFDQLVKYLVRMIHRKRDIKTPQLVCTNLCLSSRAIRKKYIIIYYEKPCIYND